MIDTARKTQRIVSHRMVNALALATPAVRMAVVEVFANRAKDGGWEPDDFIALPVLAIVARHEHSYCRYHEEGRDPRKAPTHDGMEELGWTYDPTGEGVNYDVLVDTDDYGLCEASFAMDCDNVAYRTVVCTWPPEEDAARLAPVVEQLRAEARAKVERREEVRKAVAS